MITSGDPFDRTLAEFLAKLEAAEPVELTRLAVDRARASSQHSAWLARADLAVTLTPRVQVASGNLRMVAVAAAMAAAVALGVLVGGGQRTAPDVAPSPAVSAPSASLAPDPSAGVVPPAVARGSWLTLARPELAPDGLAAADLFNDRTLVVGEEVRLFDPVDGTWVRVTQPHMARRSPAVAGLADGSVLIVGGTAATESSATPLATTEVYSPVADRWIVTGPMATARGFGHTATTLLDGRVLVVGGTEFAGLPSAEVLDPSTMTWTTTGSMREARSGHTATLLADGRVLVTGGSIVHSTALASAEIFDPATGTWTQVAPMSAERTGHTATLLNDGTVLVTGGHLAIDDASLTQAFSAYPLGDGPVASAERFDPTTGRWTPAGTMAVGRYGHTATRLPDGTVLVAGGRASDERTASAEVYDPASGAWVPAPPMSRRRAGQAASLLADGSVLVVGGDQAGNRATAERFVQLAQP